MLTEIWITMQIWEFLMKFLPLLVWPILRILLIQAVDEFL